MTLPPLILIHQCMFYTECSFPWGYVRDFPIPWTIGCIWILPLKQHCGWNLISWSDTAKCLSAVAHKFLNNMKGILEVPNKRAITNTKHSYDIYFQKRECTSPVVKYLLVRKMLRNYFLKWELLITLEVPVISTYLYFELKHKEKNLFSHVTPNLSPPQCIIIASVVVTAKLEGSRLAELCALCPEFIIDLGHVSVISLQDFN